MIPLLSSGSEASVILERSEGSRGV